MARTWSKAPLLLIFLLPLVARADTIYSFATQAQSVAVSTVSGAITISSSAAVAQTTCLLVSSNSATGQFSSSNTNFSPVSVVTMSKNSSNRTFYYQDSTAGSYTLTVKVAPKPDSVSSSCTSWSDAASNVVATLVQDITVGSATQTQSQTQSTSTPVVAQANGGNLPPTITAHITTEGAVIAGGGATFEGSAFDKDGGSLLSGVRYLWNFGDGAVAEGQFVSHTYAYPGVYVVALDVAYDYYGSHAQVAVTATKPHVVLVAERDGSQTIVNQSAADLDVGGWSITDGQKSFTIPLETTVMVNEGLRFAPAVTGVSGSNTALLYPNGTRAAGAVPSADSPLRGERVASNQVSQAPSGSLVGVPTGISPAAPILCQTPAQSDSAQLENSANAAAPALATSSMPLWAILLGLVLVLGLGAGAVWYLRPAGALPETPPAPEEFDIE